MTVAESKLVSEISQMAVLKRGISMLACSLLHILSTSKDSKHLNFCWFPCSWVLWHLTAEGWVDVDLSMGAASRKFYLGYLPRGLGLAKKAAISRWACKAREDLGVIVPILRGFL